MDSRKFQLFKTELCRNWQEMGTCRYAKKCRFAHGEEELRCVERHAKYKTEICKTFHLTGTCLYGVRCTFIHDDSPSNSTLSSPTQQRSPSQYFTEDDFSLWKTKWDSATNIWSPSFDRRYSSSSITSFLTMPFVA